MWKRMKTLLPRSGRKVHVVKSPYHKGSEQAQNLMDKKIELLTQTTTIGFNHPLIPIKTLLTTPLQ